MSSGNLKEHTTLGRTGLRVSRLGIASGYGLEAAAVEKAYHEFGINYFFWSTPRKQGMEAGLRTLARSQRDKLVIAIQSYDHSGFLTERSVDKALADLGMDYADILILGWYNSMPFRRVLDTARALIERGKIRHIGMSGHNRSFFGELAADPANPIDVFMIRYNAAHPGAERDIFPLLKKEGREGVTIYTATAWRKLLKAAKMPKGEAPLDAADCYRFVLSNPQVDVCLMGPASEKEMREGLTALDRGPLDGDAMRRIRAIGEYVHG